MLTAVKNQFKISLLSIKYALMKEMLNKVSFVTNIIIMILNNATFILQWLILFSIKDNIGGYNFKQIMFLWGVAAGTFGISRFFFKRAFELSDIINTGKLDSFLVQPKNVLLSAITTDVSTTAIGDIIYGYLMIIIFGFSIKRLIIFTILCICGGIIVTCLSIIFSSLSFWFNKMDIISDTINGLMINFGTYPDGIFKGFAKVLLYTIVPVGIAVYMPVELLINFNIKTFLIILLITFAFIFFAFFIFNKGLKRYSSSNLMSARI